MPHQIRTLLSSIACACSLWSGCKQESKEPESAPAAASATATPPPPPALEPTPAPLESIEPPLQPPPPPSAAPAAAAKPESLKACCAALHKEESTVAAKDKALYQTAANSCDAISKLVAAGTTKKAAALTQLRAGLKGQKLPAGCD